MDGPPAPNLSVEGGSLPLSGEGLPKVVSLITVVAAAGAPITRHSPATDQGEEIKVVASSATAAKGGSKEGEAMRP